MILLQYFTICFYLLLEVRALYEDQAGKFDWRQQLVGRPLSVLSDDHQPLLVATEQNVLAAISHKTGELLWRRVLERGAAGRLRLLLPSGGQFVTFSGHNLVRVWRTDSGQLVSETALDIPDTAGATYVLSAGTRELLVLQLSAAGSLLHRVTVRSGEVASERLSTPWAGEVSCVSGLETLLCHDSARLYTLSSESGRFVSAPLPASLSSSPGPRLQHLGRDLFSAAAAGRLAVLRAGPEPETVREGPGDVACLTGPPGQQLLYVGTNDRGREVPAVRFSAEPLSGGAPAASPGRVTLTRRHGPVTSCHVPAAPAGSAHRLLLIGEDDSVTMAQSGAGVLWTREEALAAILAVEVVDLPMSATEVSIEEEFADQAGDPVSALLRRMASQWSQLRSLAAGVVRPPPERAPGLAHLTRDSFNTHKMLVVVTACGKLLGLHSETGEVQWAAPLSGLAGLSASSVVLGLQRGTAHFPHPPLAALLVHPSTLVTFNPITGAELTVHRLPYRAAQASLLPHSTNTHLKPLLVLDTAGAVHVWPESAAELARSLHSKLFFYTADLATSTLQGVAVTQSLETVPSWRLDLASQGQTIRRVLAKSAQERVHSQGRVLADRSVLYKYSNPSLVLVLADAPDPVHKHSTSAYLVDAVTGHLVYSHVQRRVRCPCHAVHSENWLVYSVYNERARRTELTSIELFEGKVQANASAFSSLEAPLQPMVEKQTFIFPSQIEAMRETVTEKGITTKFIMLALPSGSVVTLPRALLDPRRPLTAARSEEGLPPYTPELPLPSVNVINYNQTLSGVTGIVSSPSGLESTCLVFIHGLDLYHTRVFPSNMFDQLKDDFDSSLIVLVLAGLISASAVTRRLAQRRALQQAWK